jgi:malate permease and related proteins
MDGVWSKYWEYATGCNVFSGMMMIGIAIGKLPKITFDWPLIGVLFLVKFLLWPLFVGVFVALDIFVLHLFDHQVYQIMLFFSVMPLIGNLVAYAAEHNLHPEKTAAAVLASSVATLVIIPCAYLVMLWLGIAG